MAKPQDDAKGQYAPSQGDRRATGVHSAKPTVITGSEDATAHSDPPKKKSGKDFELNDNPAETDKGSSG